MDERYYFLISIPQDFKEKFINFLKNLNMINENKKEPPVVIESIYIKKKIVAIPKNMELKEGESEDKINTD